MARPRGRIKTARVTVNLSDQAYAVLADIADREDVPVGQVARRAVTDFLTREKPALKQATLPLIRSTAARAGGQGR